MLIANRLLGGLLVSPANGILVVDPLWPQAGLKSNEEIADPVAFLSSGP